MGLNKEKLAKLAEQVRTGGKGSMRRKRKAPHKTTADNSKLQGTLKKLGVTPIPDIDDVAFFMDTNEVMHFSKPKVQGSMQSHTYVVTGKFEMKSMQEMLPLLLGGMGAADLEQLKVLQETLSKQAAKDGDDIPDADNFEAAADN